jgi:hypothetical protein
LLKVLPGVKRGADTTATRRYLPEFSTAKQRADDASATDAKRGERARGNAARGTPTAEQRGE